MKQIASILLAAGQSQRLGFSKQFIQLKNKSLVRGIAEKMLQLNLERNICITGAESDLVNKELNDLPIELIYNPYYKNGMSESIMTGIRSLILDEFIDAALVILVDQPFIPLEHYQSLISAYKENEKSIICTSYGKTLGAPTLFRRSLFKELLSLDQGGGAKSIIKKNKEKALSIDCSEASFDIDTPEDYIKFHQEVKFKQ